MMMMMMIRLARGVTVAFLSRVRSSRNYYSMRLRRIRERRVRWSVAAMRR